MAHGLKYLQIEYLLPLCKKEVETCARRATLERVLFPGYVFCNTDLARGPKLYHLPGIIEIVSRGRTPVSVPPEDIDMVRQIISGARSVSPQDRMLPGEEVIVLRGPLRGIKGVYVGPDKSGQLLVSFPMLCRAINIRIDRGCVESIQDHSHRSSMAA